MSRSLDYAKLNKTYDGKGSKAIDLVGQALSALTEARDSLGQGQLLRKAGMVFDSRLAISNIKESVRVFSALENKHELGKALSNLGAELCFIGDFDEAESALRESVDVLGSIDSVEQDVPLNNLATTELARDRLEQAEELLLRARKLQSEPFDVTFVSSNIGLLSLLRNKHAEAVRVYQAISKEAERHGDRLLQEYVFFNAAMALAGSGDREAALVMLNRCKGVDWRGQDRYATAKLEYHKGRLLQELGHAKEGKDLQERANEVLSGSAPFIWFYRLPYYLCDMHFWD